MLIFAVDWSMDVVELCKKYRKDGVVAIDLAGDESLNCESHPGHKRAFEVRKHTHSLYELCLLNVFSMGNQKNISGCTPSRLNSSLLALL